MIHDIDILQAVQQKLKERFPYPVYLQEVKEGFRPPAFFLKTMTVTSPQGSKEVYRDTDKIGRASCRERVFRAV